MKMIIAIIGSEDADDLVYELNQHSFFVTKLSTMGGFLKKKNSRRNHLWEFHATLRFCS